MLINQIDNALRYLPPNSPRIVYRQEGEGSLLLPVILAGRALVPSLAPYTPFRYGRARPAGEGSLAAARLIGERVGSRADRPGS